MTITLLGTLAIVLSESRPLISTLLIVVTITVAFVNMLRLQQLSNDKKYGEKSELQKGKIMSLQNNLVFEEIETLELNGNGRDFITGFGVGIGVVAGMAGIVLT